MAFQRGRRNQHASRAPRTGITDSGYNGPWRSAKIFADVAYTPAGNHRHGYPPPSECHGGLIRTGLAACVTYLVREAARATAADAIGVETVIQGGGDTRVVAVNIDHVRSRAAPCEVHRWRLSSYGWASEKSQWACVFTLMTLELGLVPLPLYARTR